MNAMPWVPLAACAGVDPALFFPDDEDLPWTELARCTEVDPSIFFPGKGEPAREAKTVCAGCEVRAECLEYAVDNGERFGVWGGLSERERRKVRADRGLPPVPPADPEPEDAKPCVGCRQVKPLTGYNVDRSTPDGRKARCRLCTAVQGRKSRHRRRKAAAA